ncbi:MAG: hypothetical protein ACKVGW_04120, partial [Verrucomicrobiia bacterium]
LIELPLRQNPTTNLPRESKTIHRAAKAKFAQSMVLRFLSRFYPPIPEARFLNMKFPQLNTLNIAGLLLAASGSSAVDDALTPTAHHPDIAKIIDPTLLGN